MKERKRGREIVCELCMCEREREILGDNEMPWLCDIQIDHEGVRECVCVRARESVWERAKEGEIECVCMWERDNGR